MATNDPSNAADKPDNVPSLFGSTSTSASGISASSPSSGVFSNNKSSLFSTTASAPGSNTFSGSSTTTLFGGTSATPPSGGLFGSSFGSSYAAPSGGLFGRLNENRTATELSSSMNSLSLHSSSNVKATESQPVNKGTSACTVFHGFEEKDPGTTRSMVCYQTITFNTQFSAFSLEELRVADYARGLKPVGSKTENGGNMLSGKPFLNTGRILNLLKGPSVEVVVGPKSDKSGEQETWNLPKSLVFHHSSFLRALLQAHDEMNEKADDRIFLAEENPAIFSLFVEFMYYEKYSLAFCKPSSRNVAAWILGHKLQSGPFKNHAMERIYNLYQLHDGPFDVPMTKEEAACVFKETQEGTKLRRFYIDFVVTHFSNACKIAGSTDEWVSLFMKYEDVRTAFFTAMRLQDRVHCVREMEYYMEKKT